jgi:hypothetical protein
MSSGLCSGNYEVYYKERRWRAAGRRVKADLDFGRAKPVLTWVLPAISMPPGAIFGNWSITKKHGPESPGRQQRLTWSGESPSASILADGSGNLHVVWRDSTPGNSEIFYKKSTNGGASWSPSLRLTSNSGQSLSPSICSDANAYLHLVWHDLTQGNAEIYYRKSTNGERPGQAAQRLSWNSGDSRSAEIAAFGSDITMLSGPTIRPEPMRSFTEGRSKKRGRSPKCHAA